ncbi:hypothetical protein GWI72_03790 [Microvirga tunisiensis]|uniref:Uncharacterized protein n=2 Tax=Pannonibacter tanglangensis TaxID=2750084 RepID=A0A7X5J761_9HYPH|nr:MULTISPECIES: hypothetical protein [unclassified Pannonibacter]NBN63737.1 hypothetical protein [Pannonibacter sp. XCT-34]NBN77384.1 hypothetical protein [Pannonibacter sp. XCT-53]
MRHSLLGRLVLAMLLLVTLPATASRSEDLIALGPYQLVNTAGFTTAADGQRTEMGTDLGTVEVLVDLTRDGSAMVLTFDQVRLTLPRLPQGLAAVDWGGSESITLRRDDILTLTGKTRLEDVDTFGARIAWPQVGEAMLVLFEAGGSSYAGFLVSRPDGRTVVRQMEAHRYFASRPRAARGH